MTARSFFILAGLLLAFLATPIQAHAQDRLLTIELADDRVDITTGFDGTKVVVFGLTSQPDADIILTLKGPERKMIVRRKDRIAGAWMNRQNVEFRRVPSYFDYAHTFGEEEGGVVTDALTKTQAGVDYLDFYAENEDLPPEEEEVFRDALIRSMQGKGFFPIKAVDVQNLQDGFFKTSFELPPGVPTGVYTVEAFLVSSEGVVTNAAKTLNVGQVGFNARVYLFADNHSFFYGLLAVLMALISGWSAFTFLRRD